MIDVLPTTICNKYMVLFFLQFEGLSSLLAWKNTIYAEHSILPYKDEFY